MAAVTVRGIFAPLLRCAKVAYLRHEINCANRDRATLLAKIENDRMAAAYLQREACIMQSDLNLLVGRSTKS